MCFHQSTRRAVVVCCRVEQLIGGVLIACVAPSRCHAGTVVAAALQCTRRAWLQERFGGTPGDKALLGTLGHDLLQRAVAARARGDEGVDAGWLRQQVRRGRLEGGTQYPERHTVKKAARSRQGGMH
jgi:hypothetical protein